MYHSDPRLLQNRQDLMCGDMSQRRAAMNAAHNNHAFYVSQLSKIANAYAEERKKEEAIKYTRLEF